MGDLAALVGLQGRGLHTWVAENIARTLIAHAVSSERYTGQDPARAFELTLEEHTRIVEAISAGDREAARIAMSEHILSSWQRRRLPSAKKRAPHQTNRN